MPPGVEVHANAAGLFIFRPEMVEPILQSDPGFYRPNGEDTWAAIARVSPDDNGDLLGYGCRSMLAGDCGVIIYAVADRSRIYAGFTAHSETADTWALQRLSEIAHIVDEPLTYEVIARPTPAP